MVARLSVVLAFVLLAGCLGNGEWEALEWSEGGQFYQEFPAPGFVGDYNVTHWEDSKVAMRFEGGRETSLRAYADGNATFYRSGPHRIGETKMEALLPDVFGELGLAAPNEAPRLYRHDKIPD